MTARLVSHPDPDHPGWDIFGPDRPGLFTDVIAPIHVRAAGPGRAMVRMVPRPGHGNIAGALHGGATMAFIDIALFAGASRAGVSDVLGGVTVDCSVQFIAAGRLDTPVEAEVELLRETRRMAFVRGLVRQGDGVIAAFSATLRKASR